MHLPNLRSLKRTHVVVGTRGDLKGTSMPIEQKSVNRSAICFELREARNAIDALITEIQLGKHDEDENLSPLSYLFGHIQSHLCRAWHSKWMSDEDLDTLSKDEFNEMSDSVPNWTISLKLVDINEPRKFDKRRGDNK